jgi:CBS domain-containing protein
VQLGGAKWPDRRAVIVSSAVKDVMSTPVVAVRDTASYKDIIIALRQWRISACPVLDTADHVIGVVSEADLLLREVGSEPFTGPGRSLRASGRRGERAKAAGETAAELMSTPPVTIGPRASVADAARLMYERGVKRLPVVDSTGQLVGIVSRIDVLSVFTRPDAQIRDDILREVIAGTFALDPVTFKVTVTSGIVTVIGQVDSHGLARQLLDTVRHVDGVIEVRDRVSYPADDAPEATQHIVRRPAITWPNGRDCDARWQEPK